MKFKSMSVLLLAVIASACVDKNHPANNSTHMAADDVAHPDAPLTANTRFAAGQVAESQGDMARAITQYKEAIKLEPTASAPLLRLGMVYTNIGQFDDAVTTWNQYVKVTSNAAAGYCNLGYTLEMAQRVPEAEAAYKTALQKEPKSEAANVNYGLMLARQGRIDEATNRLLVVLTPAEAHYNLASIFEGQGKIPAARDEYQRALSLDPEMSDAKARLAALETN